MRTDQSGSDVLQYILSDHLGSTSTIVDTSGEYVARTGYMPWGDERFSTADIPTDYRYTGQRFEDDLGIYYYNARWYDPSIGRFLQADTIVPDPGNPLAYDRYAYVLYNPLRYTDPSGHMLCDSDGYCGTSAGLLFRRESNYEETNSYKWWEYLISEGPAMDKLGDFIFSNNTVSCSSGGWSCVGGIMSRAYLQEDHATIGWRGVKLLRNDPELIKYQNQLVERAKNDPRYGNESYSIVVDSEIKTFGQYGSMLEDATHPETWMVRAATIDATIKVSEIGNIIIDYKLYDVQDLRPDWSNPLRTQSGYNLITTITGAVWHELLGASDQMEVMLNGKLSLEQMNNENKMFDNRYFYFDCHVVC